MRGRFRLVQSLSVLFGVVIFVAAGTAVEAKAKTDKKEKAAGAKAAAKAIEKASYGTVDGKPVDIYTLTNSKGAVAKITNYGAIVTELHMPDKTGKMGDVVLGFDKVDDYVAKSPYFGAIVGRVANRIANGDVHARRQGVQAERERRAPPPARRQEGLGQGDLDGGAEGDQDGPSLKLTHVSPDGEENYPGTVTATATYTLTNENELKVEMHGDHGQDDARQHGPPHVLEPRGRRHDPGPRADDPGRQVHARAPPMVPDGKIKPVKGTPFDFTTAEADRQGPEGGGRHAVGFDHNWVVNGDPHAMRLIAKLKDPKSGRVLTITADQPGLQFYSGNFMDGKTKRQGRHARAVRRALPGVAEVPQLGQRPRLEARRSILKPGQTYKHTMIHKFTTE